jgi:hypothetical protein
MLYVFFFGTIREFYDVENSFLNIYDEWELNKTGYIDFKYKSCF